MNNGQDSLERRRDPRRQAHLPIMLQIEGSGECTPAHLVDLSTGGAALVTTSYNAPLVGQHIDVQFELTNGNDHFPEQRNEAGIVMNVAPLERGVARLGIRFVQQHGFGAGLGTPIDSLMDHRRSMPAETIVNRWDTARNFDLFRKNRDKEPVGSA